MSDTLKKLQKTISEVLGCKEEEVVPTASLEHDLGADSLDVVELCMAVEDDFDIEIPDEDADAIKTVQQYVDYLNARIKS